MVERIDVSQIRTIHASRKFFQKTATHERNRACARARDSLVSRARGFQKGRGAIRENRACEYRARYLIWSEKVAPASQNLVRLIESSGSANVYTFQREGESMSEEETVKVSCVSLRMVREETLDLPGSWVQNANQAAAIAKHMIGDRPIEHIIAILVNGRGQVTGVTKIAQGGASGVGVKPCDVLRAVLVGQAAGFVLAHNHPSGDPTPSKEDVDFTRKIARAAEIVGCPLLDHIVVTEDGSFRSIGCGTGES